MIILLHVVSAIAGLLLAGASLFMPHRTLIRASYAFVAVMLVTGTYLTASLHAALLPACVSGLAYTSLTFGMCAIARQRLGAQTK